MVGVNQFTRAISEKEENLPIEDSRMQEEQIQRLRDFKQSRDNMAVTGFLEKLKQAARGEENLMPFFVEGVEAGATLGEISEALVTVFGRHQPIS